jgi:hypothetical protein
MGKREVIFFLMMANPCKLLDGTKNIPFKVWKKIHIALLINWKVCFFFLESDFYEKLIIFLIFGNVIKNKLKNIFEYLIIKYNS